mgnify:CR=1 FL=1
MTPAAEGGSNSAPLPPSHFLTPEALITALLQLRRESEQPDDASSSERWRLIGRREAFTLALQLARRLPTTTPEDEWGTPMAVR